MDRTYRKRSKTWKLGSPAGSEGEFWINDTESPEIGVSEPGSPIGPDIQRGGASVALSTAEALEVGEWLLDLAMSRRAEPQAETASAPGDDSGWTAIPGRDPVATFQRGRHLVVVDIEGDELLELAVRGGDASVPEAWLVAIVRALDEAYRSGEESGKLIRSGEIMRLLADGGETS